MPFSLLDENEAEEPVVTFPDDYPNSVRHFLLIGFLGMFIGAIVFFYMGISRKVNTITHVLTFFIAAVAACAYYAMWAGLGVEYKTTDTTPRVIFWARYLDWIVTTPVRCSHHPIWRLSALSRKCPPHPCISLRMPRAPSLPSSPSNAWVLCGNAAPVLYGSVRGLALGRVALRRGGNCAGNGGNRSELPWIWRQGKKEGL